MKICLSKRLTLSGISKLSIAKRRKCPLCLSKRPISQNESAKIQQSSGWLAISLSFVGWVSQPVYVTAINNQWSGWKSRDRHSELACLFLSCIMNSWRNIPSVKNPSRIFRSPHFHMQFSWLKFFFVLFFLFSFFFFSLSLRIDSFERV